MTDRERTTMGRYQEIRAYADAHPRALQADIAKLFGVSVRTIGKALSVTRLTPSEGEPDTIHATEAHVETAVITPTKERTCSHCGATLVPGAKYCHICGTMYVDPRELCIRALEKLAQNISTFYPRTARDNAIAQITMIREYIESTCEEV